MCYSLITGTVGLSETEMGGKHNCSPARVTDHQITKLFLHNLTFQTYSTSTHLADCFKHSALRQLVWSGFTGMVV